MSTTKQVNVRLELDVIARLDRLAERHGGRAQAIAAALAALDGAPAASTSDAANRPAELRAAADELERLRRLVRFVKPSEAAASS